jgi:PAS domain S-box-containing protein
MTLHEPQAREIDGTPIRAAVPESAHHSDQRYRALADSMPQLVWATDADGRHFYFNRRWYEYTGMTEAESLGFGFADALHPDDRQRTLDRWARAWRDGEGYEIEYRFRRHDGSYHWFIGRASPVCDASGRVVEWVGTCTDIDEQKRASEVGRFLGEASDVLASSLDYEETLAHVARLVVPHIADWCAIDVCEPNGQLERLAVAHVDQRKVALAEEIYHRWPPKPSDPSGIYNVIRTGKPEVVPVITEQMVHEGIPDPELRDIFLDIGLSAMMIVPLTVSGRTLGAITLAAAESGRFFGEADLALAQDLARRAAVAIEQAQLYRELRQFKTTLDQTRDCVFMFDPETLQFFYVNQGAIEQVGYTAEELLCMTPLDIKPEYDAARFRAMVAPLLAGEVGLHTFETVHRHKDGHDVPVEVVLQHVVSPDVGGRFVAVVRDVSERKQAELRLRESEHRYRALADAMPLVVWTADAAGSVTSFNQRWFEYTGRTSTETLGDGWQPVIHPDDLERTISAWGHAVATGEPYEIEYRWRRGTDGAYRWWLGRALPVHDDHGRTAYWVGTGTDIDDRKQHEAQLATHTEELAHIAKMLEDRNRELDQFAYVTSHDLKAPLRGIANLSQWIEEDFGREVPAEVRSHLDLLRGRINRMESLIDGILLYSRIGRTTNSQEPVDVRALLEEIVDLLAPPPDVIVVSNLDLPPIKAQRMPLQQVLSNLIGNAIKHRGGKPVTITVDAQVRGGLVEFSVRDTGPGIAPPYHERIFGIFQTLVSRDKVEGSGLGLALVKKIVEHQGGKVRLESDEGQGAAFFFTWPYLPT